MPSEKHPWLKPKGYLHLTPQIDVVRKQKSLLTKITNPDYVSRHAFYPLIHAVIKERKYKKIPNTTKRAHSYKDENGNTKHTAKERPLHYSSNMDALIFGYYAHTLQGLYEDTLKNTPLSDCIIAYRKIPNESDGKNKSTIHFAKEVFDEIKKHSENGCSVLMFDIKSFFSRIDHKILEQAWCRLIAKDSLPSDHKNVFNASTNFSYILLDDLRVEQKGSRKSGFDEKKLAQNRKMGIRCFFESSKEFRDKIKNKEIIIYKHPFRNKDKEPVGIPQGLAISATLANLYLLEFDKKVYKYVVEERGGFYRRYSDDILVICKPNEVEEVKQFMKETIEESKVQISTEKTEEYLFRLTQSNYNKTRLTSIKIKETHCHIGCPLTYLGFEFYGYQTLIKSSNLAKFYRRMKSVIKTKAKRARQLSTKSPDNKYAVFRRQLYKLYMIHDLSETTVRTSISKLVKNDRGDYVFKIIKLEKPIKSNYLSYVTRASEIMGDNSIKDQIRNHKKIFNETVNKRINKYKDWEF